LAKHPILAAVFASSGLFIIYLALTGFSGIPLFNTSESTYIGITGNFYILMFVGVVLLIIGLYEIIKKDKQP